MHSALVAVLLLAQEPVAEPTPEKAFKPKVTLSGGISGGYVYREGALEEARGNLNSASGSTPDSDFFAGRATMRLEATVRPTIRGLLELENKPYSAGANNPFGEDRLEAFVEQAYVEVREFLTPKLTLRAGVQDLKLTLRPHAESFFLDVAESESFFSGASFGPSGSFVRATADRDLSEAAGARLVWDPEEFLSFHAFAGIVRESGPPSADESLFYAYGNLWIPETVSGFLLLALVSGPAHESAVITIGAGADAYMKPWLEAFGEVYVQAGTLDSSTDKRAWAVQLGARAWMMKWFVEGGFVHRSGDSSATDGDDESFQSYESENQFLLVENAEVGLDWDTNLRSLRLSAGLQSADLGGRFRDVTLRLDFGLFRFNEALRSSTGSILLSTTDDSIGNEIDASAVWAYDESLSFQVRFGALFGSDVLERLTASGDRSALAVLVGGSFRF